MRKKYVALIEYENCNYATQAKDYLNNIKFFKNTLKVY